MRERAFAGCMALPMILVGSATVVLVAIFAPQHLVPTVAILAGSGMASGLMFQWFGRRTRAERDEWAREVYRLERQLELMQQKQAKLQETITWQGRLLEESLVTPGVLERPGIDDPNLLLKVENRKPAGRR